jgi:hypothetical protein
MFCDSNCMCGVNGLILGSVGSTLIIFILASFISFFRNKVGL